MFANTAYEALFEYLGLELHSRFIEVLTSQRVFMAALLMIFGVMFFTTTLRFFSRYLPGSLVKRRPVALGSYVRITACLFIGMNILRVTGSTGVSQFDGSSWHTNPYVTGKNHAVQSEYRVSFVFELLSRTAEESARLLNRIVDQIFRTTNSEIEAPEFFYKAILYAGASTVQNPELRSAIKLYTDNCISRVLPLINTNASKDAMDRMDSVFRSDAGADDLLASFNVERDGQPGFTCLDAKNEVRSQLEAEATGHWDEVGPLVDRYLKVTSLNDQTYRNLRMSMALVDHYIDQSEGALGIQKGSQPPSGSARVVQYVNRLFSWDGLMSIFGRERHGAALAASRSQEFSENLTRAPHVAGFIKLALIAIFPWLVFPIVAGRWRVLVWWMAAYTSVLMWAPIWTLFYHIVTGIALSTDTLAAFGELSDGISLYSANLITSRMNYMYAAYSWLQLLIGAAFTGSVLWFARPLLADQTEETTPEFVGEAGRVAGGVARVV